MTVANECAVQWATIGPCQAAQRQQSRQQHSCLCRWCMVLRMPELQIGHAFRRSCWGVKSCIKSCSLCYPPPSASLQPNKTSLPGDMALC